jgi:iron uptake system component EfeO
VSHVRFRSVAALPLALALALGACGGDDDDGADVRNVGEECGSGSAAASGGSGSASGGSGSASGGSGSAACGSASGGSGSGSGIAGEVEGSSTDNPLVEEALVEYKAYVLEQVDETIAGTTTFTDAVRAGDLEGAQAAYAPSRQGWERIEPIAGLVEELDGALDARVDDFEGPDDPNFTGWHRIEYILWEQGTTDGAAEFADQLDEDLQTLRTELEGMDIPPAALAVGSSELIEEVSTGKITGEEDRYSHTDLWDFAANVEGSERGFELLTPALEQEDPELVTTIDELFTELEGQLAEYEDGQGGYVSYEELTEDDRTAMQTTLAELSESLATMAGVLGLE